MILFYEDEQDTIQDEMDDFKEKGYKPICFDNADTTIAFYESNYENIKAVIIDLMVFGPRNEFDSDNNSGFESGVRILDSFENIDLKQKSFSIPLKFIYTNRNKVELLNSLEQDKRVAKVCQKNQQFYDEFVDIVINQIKDKY